MTQNMHTLLMKSADDWGPGRAMSHSRVLSEIFYLGPYVFKVFGRIPLVFEIDHEPIGVTHELLTAGA